MDQLEGSSEKIRSSEEIQKSIDALLERMKEMNSENASAGSQSSVAIAKKKITERSMTMLLFATVISIVLISALLVTTTWAWFTESVSAADNSISSAYVTIDTVVDESGTPILSTASGSTLTYELSSGVEYTVTITVVGTGKGGYVRLYYGTMTNEVGCTEVVLSDTYTGMSVADDINTMSFTISLEEAGTVIIKTAWGDHGRDDAEIVSGGKYIISTEGVLSEMQADIDLN